MPNYAAKLQPSSLYIATQSIPTAAYQLFHWFLLTTASDGSTTSHQWVEVDGNVGNTEEQYICLHAPTCTTFTKNPTVVAYFRVEGFDASCTDAGETSAKDDSDVSDAGSDVVRKSMFEEACASAFQTHYPTMRENRAHGISCMSWVLSILQFLEQQGYIRRDDELSLRNLEEDIKRASAEQEELLMKTLMVGKRFTAGVFTI